jgi:hypothetical protein
MEAVVDFGQAHGNAVNNSGWCDCLGLSCNILDNQSNPDTSIYEAYHWLTLRILLS